MSLIHAFILGLAQGLTEFFPISSSLHLRLLSNFMNLEPDPSFFLFCHVATSFSVIIYFRKTLYLQLFKKESLLYALALFPLVIFYVFFGKWVKGLSDLVLGPLLILTSFLLFFLKEQQEKPRAFPRKIRDVLFIGSMQSLALMPGLSRSASTMFAATKRGWSMKEAFSFSYILSVPTVWGGLILEKELRFASFFSSSYLVAGMSAFTLGLLALMLVEKLLTTQRFFYFGYYCLGLGLFLTFYRFAI